MTFLHAFKNFLRDVLRDRSTTLEEYIVSKNPQTPFHVEQLEREWNAKQQRGRMI